jgi:hypothetical protein
MKKTKGRQDGFVGGKKKRNRFQSSYPPICIVHAWLIFQTEELLRYYPASLI